MGPPKPDTRMTSAEYLAFLETSPELYEFHAGEIFAMSGGSPAHAQLTNQLAVVVGIALRGKPCRGQNTAQRIQISDYHAVYPDLSVVCPPLEYAANDRQAIVNPTAVFEVLSLTTFKSRGRATSTASSATACPTATAACFSLLTVFPWPPTASPSAIPYLLGSDSNSPGTRCQQIKTASASVGNGAY